MKTITLRAAVAAIITAAGLVARADSITRSTPVHWSGGTFNGTALVKGFAKRGAVLDSVTVALDSALTITYPAGLCCAGGAVYNVQWSGIQTADPVLGASWNPDGATETLYGNSVETWTDSSILANAQDGRFQLPIAVYPLGGPITSSGGSLTVTVTYNYHVVAPSGPRH